MSDWIKKVKEYHAFYGGSYKDAMKKAKEQMNKPNLKLDKGAPSPYMSKPK